MPISSQKGMATFEASITSMNVEFMSNPTADPVSPIAKILRGEEESKFNILIELLKMAMNISRNDNVPKIPVSPNILR